MDVQHIFSGFGIEILRREDRYFLRYDSGELVVRMTELEISADDAVLAAKSEKSAYDVILKVESGTQLLLEIDRALSIIRPMLTPTWTNVRSIHRQLMWCRAQISGEPSEPKAGPLTMGLIATREFDMWGDNPELAALINRIQRAIE